ncbi:hypothetical protein PRZ48_011560 [Zasmidium cellare]|uniref:Zn(2)-C6 fungal-type domain-containing protein n=1 Tax=Zasmidium cellare TaxID=395010 RepID=A0ABR0E782_ZASCE|nr:hypothetical protein PRZ48_011560 [Zasmidium cellare]
MAADDSIQRASQVCNNCKTRKKACDKLLPTCSYCSKRGLACRYERTPESRAESAGVSVGSIADLLSCDVGPKLDGLVNLQVCHAIHRTGISIDELANRFFHYFHQWLPIISPATFRETATKYQHGVPPADFSVLLLSMYVIVLRPTDGPMHKDDIRPKDLYNTVKIFLGHVQTKLCSSILLVQATILVASYEYACGKPGGAYVSLGLALRMGYVLELQHSVMPDSLHKGPLLQHSRAEQKNIWWGIIVMERLIVLELPSKHLSLSTRYPRGQFEFPADLSDDFNGNTPSTNGAGNHHDHVTKDDFANVVRACYYLDAVLMTMDSMSSPGDLNGQILDFLRIAMGSSAHAPHSETLTIATRSLMLCHKTILNHLPSEDIEQRRSTEDALDSAATMILEAAYDHSEHFGDIDAISLSCFYCLDVALQQYEKRPNLQQQGHITQAAQSARCLMGVFRGRWPTP